jgi:hypothetical protein
VPDRTFEVLHRARIRGLVPAEALGPIDDLVAASLLLVSAQGCMLTPAGLRRHEELLVAWRASVDLDTVATAYEHFLAVNQPVKRICARWQGQEDDAEALFVAVDGLSDMVERVTPALLRAGAAVPRFSTYTERLASALRQAGDGDRRYITDPRVDSVHTIWFECHEDFLITLGRDREAEGSY